MTTPSTATVAISYYLTEAGRRASLLAGGDGKRDQLVYAPVTPELLAVVTVSPDGSVGTRIWSGHTGAELDAPLTADEAVTRVLSHAADVAAKAVTMRTRATVAWREAAKTYLADLGSDAYFECNDNPGLHPAGYGKDTDCTPDEISAVLAEHARREQSKRDAETALLRSEIPRWMSGEIACFSSAPSKSGLTDDEKSAIDAEAERRKAKAAADKIAQVQTSIDERDAWIRAHGSARLRKGLDLGQIRAMANVYRDERIRHDLAGAAPDCPSEWIAWNAAPEPDDKDLLNPSESALDALAAAKTKWQTSGARLRSVGGTDKGGDEHEWRPALMIDCPWDGTTAISYLDGEGPNHR